MLRLKLRAIMHHICRTFSSSFKQIQLIHHNHSAYTRIHSAAHTNPHSSRAGMDFFHSAYTPQRIQITENMLISPMTQNCLCLCCNQSIDPSRAAGFVTGRAKCLAHPSRAAGFVTGGAKVLRNCLCPLQSIHRPFSRC